MNKIKLFVIAFVAFAVFACSENKKEQVVIHKAKETPDLLAQVNGKPLYEKDLSIRYQTRLFDTKKQLVESYLREQLLDEYLAKKGYTRKDFFEKEIKGKAKEPSETEIKKFYNDRNIKQPYENVKENIVNALKGQQLRTRQQEFFDNLMADTTVVYYFERPRVEVVLTDEEIAEGPKDAPVTLVEFTEFKCPHCSRVQDTLKQLKEKYKGKIRHVYKNFPIPSHKFAREASNAAYCAHEQGKFWPYHYVVYEKQQEINDEKLIEWAKDFDMDMAKFEQCYKDKRYDKLIQRDLDQAQKYGVSSTPTFMINGISLVGAQPLPEFEKIIEEELKNKKN